MYISNYSIVYVDILMLAQEEGEVILYDFEIFS